MVNKCGSKWDSIVKSRDSMLLSDEKGKISVYLIIILDYNVIHLRSIKLATARSK